MKDIQDVDPVSPNHGSSTALSSATTTKTLPKLINKNDYASKARKMKKKKTTTKKRVDFSNAVIHPFHRFLPPHYIDKEDGIPFSVKWAHRKARHIVSLVQSLQLTEDMLHQNDTTTKSSPVTAEVQVSTTVATASNTSLNHNEGIFDDEFDDEEDLHHDDDGDDASEYEEEEEDDDDCREDDECEEEMNQVDQQWLASHEAPTLASLVKKCHRIYTQLVALQQLKYGGITQMEYCAIVLKVLRLLCATVSYTDEIHQQPHVQQEGREWKDNLNKNENYPDYELRDTEYLSNSHPTTTTATTTTTRRKATATIHWDHVGYIYSSSAVSNHETLDKDQEDDPMTIITNDHIILEETSENQPKILEHFALPTPARESLLNIAIHILDKKSLLRSVSTAGMIVPTFDQDIQENKDCITTPTPFEVNDDTLLILHWKVFYRLLLRTAPHLDEKHRLSEPPMDSSSHASKVFQSTINLIRCCRRFYDQGLDIKTNIITDKSSEEIWSLFYPDLYKTYSNNCFKSSILIYLFHPSRCSEAYYRKVMPLWIDIWKSIDRTPTFDYIWITMICRARKYSQWSESFWDTLQTRLLTLLQMWLHIPVGGTSNDKLFPQSSRAAMRSIPTRLKVFTGIDSSEDETANLFRKVSKLLCLSIFIQGKSKEMNEDDVGGTTTIGKEFTRTKNILDLFRFVSPYFNPSNTGSW